MGAGDPRCVLAGHGDAVTCLAADGDLDLLVSGAADGVLLFHTLSSGRWVPTHQSSSLTPPKP